MTKRTTATACIVLVGVLGGWAIRGPAAAPVREAPTPSMTVLDYGAVADGLADDTSAIQRAVDSGMGQIRFPKGVFRITLPIVIDLDKVGFTSITGDGVARIVMAGPGPAFRLVGTHEGTAAPTTVEQNVWRRQRAPVIERIEIVGGHPQARGIEAVGTMKLTLSGVVIRDALHGVHLVKRNRNVIISECHLYNNRGVGVFLDGVNLHQINIANCHISYNAGGGVVARDSEIRNLQIGVCDIEGNMGGPESEPTANVLLDSKGSSIGEVTIVGCTIQHAHDAPHSANIRIDGSSTRRAHTDELRHGNITIADNVLSDVQVNVEIRNTRAVTITGNTMWKGYASNLIVDHCAHVVVANNVFDRNPRYHYGDGADAKLGLVFTDSSDCTITGNHVHGVGSVSAAVLLRRCRRMNVTACVILDYGECGLLLDDVSQSRVSDCLIGDENATATSATLRVTGGSGNMIVDNLLGGKTDIDDDAAVVKDNVIR